MHSPHEEGRLSPPNSPKKVATLFEEGSSSRCPTGQDEQGEVAPVTSRCKGKVLQQNDLRVAEIYVPDGRMCLRNFKSEAAAARPCDSEATKLHDGESDRNLTLTGINIHEPNFQRHFSHEGNESILTEFIPPSHTSISSGSGLTTPTMIDNDIPFKEMFRKELTPSDVGKLNRLVIPKKQAMYFFPPVPPNHVKEDPLEFQDRTNRLWKFRYCYWKSSQSFVFTKGWNRFVKEKELRAKDTVVFYVSKKMEGSDKKTFFMIDVLHHAEGSRNVEAENNPMEDANEFEKPIGYEEEDEVKSGNLMDRDESEGKNLIDRDECEGKNLIDRDESEGKNLIDGDESKGKNLIDRNESEEKNLIDRDKSEEKNLIDRDKSEGKKEIIIFGKRIVEGEVKEERN